MNKKEKIAYIFGTLAKKYHGATTELVYSTPFQLIVAVVMSAQTTDKQVNNVTAHFFDIIKTPKDLLKIPFEKWEKMIAWVNYYKNKARNIYKMAGELVSKKYLPEGPMLSPQQQLSQQFLKKWWYRIPDTQNVLMQLPWVWEKTAKVMLHVLYKQPVIAVDTHVHRVTNRLWIVKTNEPLQTSKILETIVPDEYKQSAHHSLIMFGRYFCTARNPRCAECPFATICPWYKKNKNISRKRQ